MSSTLTVASREWSTRPADERFTSLFALAAFKKFEFEHKRRKTIPNRELTVIPSTTDPLDIAITGPNGHPAKLTNWSYSQLATLSGVPGDYIVRSKMPAALAADNFNWGLHHARTPESISVLLRQKEDNSVWLGALNGPNYGPVWDSEIVDTLVNEFGDGVTGDWCVPGEFSKKLPSVTKENTTLYASDRDMWVFLADETNRIEIPNRRAGKSTSLARGFYIGNSEVGAKKLTLGTFLFDYVCCNRMIWGARDHNEINIRHTAAAPYRWLEEVKPILKTLKTSSPKPITESIKEAQNTKIKTDIDTFLASRFGVSSAIKSTHMLEEGRPIETIWDAVVGATAYARELAYVDSRVKIEREAGVLLAKLGKNDLETISL
jgi:hypothetical protein